MSRVSCEFPALVRRIGEGKNRQFSIRPLFMSGPLGEARLYEKAMRNFQNDLRRHFQSFNMDRSQAEEALWNFFNPNLNYENLKLSISLGQSFIKGFFGAAWFDLKGERFVVLPGFDNEIFTVPRVNGERPGKAHTLERIREVIEELIRKKQKKSKDEENQNNDWVPEDAMSRKGDFTTLISIELNLNYSGFPFESSGSDLFYFLTGGQPELDGGQEIEKVGRDLNLSYPDELNRAFYREDLTGRLMTGLYGRKKKALVLVGPSGGGKSTLIHEAVFRHMQEFGPRRQLSKIKKVWHFDPNRVISGMSVVGQWQRRFEAIIRFAMRRKRNPRGDVLYTDNLPALARVGISAHNNMTLADVLKPFLEKREVSFLGEATPEEWKVFQELNRSVADLLEVIRVPEPPRDNALRMLLHERSRLEVEFNCEITNEAVAELIGLRRTFLGRSALPGALSSLFRLVALKYRNSKAGRTEALAVFQESRRLAPGLTDNRKRLMEGEAESHIRERLIGQEQASAAMLNVLHRVKAGLADPERPQGVFLFIGPTGVGKTEAALALASYLHQSEEHLIRFDMNEYVDSGAPGRLIGDYSRPSGRLTEMIRYQPHAVVLFDEIEKAHPSVHDLLLQLLGEGRLTDAIGRTTDFTGTIIIMTSNLGSLEAGRIMGFSQTEESVAGAYEKAVREFFRPEFLNRIDTVIPFSRLSLEHIIKIARLQIRKLLLRDGFLRRNMLLHISEGVLEELAKSGFNAALGGRALKRAIEKDLTAMTAEKLAELPPGSPMLFEVALHGGALQPRITPLTEREPVSFRPPIPAPDKKSLRDFCQSLIEDVEKDLAKLSSSNSDEEVSISDWLFYSLKDSLQDMHADLRTILNNMKQFYERPAGTAIFRKRMGLNRKPPRFIDELTRMELSEQYTRSGFRGSLFRAFLNAEPAAIRDHQSMFSAYKTDAAFLRFFIRGRLEQESESVCIRIRPLSVVDADREIRFLASFYKKTISLFQFSAESFDSPHEIFVFGQGLRLPELFKDEAGLHLFFTPDGNALPLLVELLSPPADMEPRDFIKIQKESASPPDRPRPMVRLYSLPDAERTDEAILDLRSSVITKGDPSELELKYMFYPGDAR